ncbi:MAG: ATP-dependent DNA helicase [Lachnospirales bacterium]
MNINISVRDIVELVYRCGNIDSTYRANKVQNSMQEGIRLHTKLQKKREKECKNNNITYIKEKSVKHSFITSDINFEIKGRIDGIFYEDDITIIEEIKSTSTNLDNILNPPIDYLSQLKLYGYILLKEENLQRVKLNLTYISVQDESLKTFEYYEDISTLDIFFNDLISKYLNFAILSKDIYEEFHTTSSTMSFPYENFREHQYKLMGVLYRTIKSKENTFIEAPTGTGKTISTIFPSIKALEKDLSDKIFYATAKTITRKVAFDTILFLEKKGLKMRSIFLRAKDKSCPLESRNCTPEHCEYAKGHFDRLNNGLLDILKNETTITPEILQEYSLKHTLCPYEYSLDITNFCHFIVCDYNNIYHPTSKLIRYFEIGGEYILLFDEAHNLQDRALDMYSTTISTDYINNFFENTKLHELDTKIGRSKNSIYDNLSAFNQKLANFETLVLTSLPNSLVKEIYNLKKHLDNYIDKKNSTSSTITDFIFSLIEFIKIIELYGDNYKTIIYKENDILNINLKCIDASYFISNINSLCTSTIYFSATLSPLDFYKNSYGEENSTSYVLPSPFNQENCLYLLDNSISTYYKTRHNFTKSICEKIHCAISEKIGNYFIFFSSYAHMELVYSKYIELYNYDKDIKIVPQKRNMLEKEKSAFVRKFKKNPKKTTLGFLVLGGMFSEGIDLTYDRLIGVIIVGVGLPKITTTSELMKEYYNEKLGGQGFDYAYTYKGITKISQAIGRLIRTENDKGFVLLMDIRYTKEKYLDSMPFNNYYVVKKKIHIKNLIKDFWQNANF